jgi:hypothetical protein
VTVPLEEDSNLSLRDITCRDAAHDLEESIGSAASSSRADRVTTVAAVRAIPVTLARQEKIELGGGSASQRRTGQELSAANSGAPKLRTDRPPTIQEIGESIHVRSSCS